MKKIEAINLFGGKATFLAKALGKTKSAISQWPEDLDENQINMVIGAAYRHGVYIPDQFKKISSISLVSTD